MNLILIAATLTAFAIAAALNQKHTEP